MAQKTNLNVSPYYDDFDANKQFYKILFNPGKPIQARELTTLQSLLQNQVESFGSHIFKEGSMVVPGGITYDSQFYAVKLNTTNLGVPISLYLNELIGKTVTGEISGVNAVVQYVQVPNTDVTNPTIYVKYLNSDNNFIDNPFRDTETLVCNEPIVYGNTTINANTSFASLIDREATSIGSAVSISDGIYFIRGYFVKVNKETIILDYYTNTPSYRVGLKVEEKIITVKEDNSLYDNAKGFTNYAAPGADRFKISVSLTKKSLTDVEDTDFIELLRVSNGTIKKIQSKTEYSLLRDYLAKRTYEESGDYSVNPFLMTLHDSLNNRMGNDGLFFNNEKTENGNNPNKDLMCLKVSPGKAYVRGYDVEKLTSTVIDLEKPRSTELVPNTNVPFEMGNLLRICNVSGSARNKVSIQLYNSFKTSTSSPSGVRIGDAKVYMCKLTDAAYSNSSTRWDLYLFDIQTYTELNINKEISSKDLPISSYIQGKSSGASGYAVYAGSNGSKLTLRQTSGTFIKGEQLIINGVDTNPRSISQIKVYTFSDIKSVYQESDAGSGFPYAFLADCELDKVIAPGFSSFDKINITSSGTVTASGKYFTGITTDTIIRYQRPGLNLETFNKVASVNSLGTSMTLVGINSINGVFDGGLTTTDLQTTFSIGAASLKNQEKGYLYTKLPDKNISNVNLADSNLSASYQITGESTDGSGILSFNIGQLAGISSAFFQPFDAERYSVHYSNGGIGTVRSDQFLLSGNTVTISGLSGSQSNIVVNATILKNGVQSRVKTFNRSKTVNINYSKYIQSGTGISTSFNDGLEYSPYHGLRVQDNEICLNYPDVSQIIAIYQSLNTSDPVLDQIQVTSTSNVDTNAIIGENIIGSSSGSIARVVSKPSTNTLGIVYLNRNRFSKYEEVTFEDSNIVTEIEEITVGSYKDLTYSFTLDRGQKEQYYDYSRIIRNKNVLEPDKKLLIVFDYYSVPSNDDGDVFTVLSYPNEAYDKNIPLIGKDKTRATDILDFRPRVPVFTPSTASLSPFDFSSRSFGTEPKYILSPNEGFLVSYEYYLGRIDTVFLDKFGSILIDKGVPSKNPKAPLKNDDVMDLGTITLPPYLFSIEDAQISLIDNRRYTMRDIGVIEDRVENLESVTSLSLLELNTQTLQIQDADGLNRFKTGFFVDDFKNTDLIDPTYSSIQIDASEKVLRPIVSRNSLKSQIVPASNFTDESLDLSTDFDLLDKNVKKSDQVITLNYDEIGWIEQPLATKVENVNPFHVVLYNGTVQLSPSSDNWVRIIRLQEVITTTSRIEFGWRGTRRDISSVDVLISSGADVYMRSRNTQFSATNIKPLTRFYQFFDSNSGVDFVPKLVEISVDSTLQNFGSLGIFQVGETVIGTVNGQRLISFRVAQSNHKYGPYNNPTTTFNINPYFKSETIPANYSGSSKILNIDTFSLSEEAQGKYSGYLTVGMQLVGQTSGAVAFVKDLKLVSDNYGDLIGTFFLRDPNTNPPPSVRIGTGTKTYRLSSSSTNSPLLPGSKLISSAETTYRSEGIVNTRQVNTTITNVTGIIPPSPPPPRRGDPLAQSFTVGDNIGNAPDASGSSDDNNGCFLTSVDLFFANKDQNNSPITVEIRTVNFGTPTLTRVGKPKVLRPEDIVTSSTGEVATHVTFDHPIYLAPGEQYAIVLLAPESDQYEVWIAEMGEQTINTKSLPSAESVRYTRQFAVGRLYKSQNGSEWTANDYQDMKFKLYKAKFTSNSGTAYFYNPTLDQSNGYVPNLGANPVTSNGRKLTVGIVTTSNSTLVGILTAGRKVSMTGKTFDYGYVVGTGSSVASVGITTSGSNYSGTTQLNVNTFPIIGNGSGLVLDLTINNGGVTAATIVSRGNGYMIGDVVGVVTSTAGNTGTGARITVTNSNGIDTLYLDNVQGESFTVGSQLRYYDNNGVAVSLASTTIRSSSSSGNQFSGNYLQVNHFNHGMYAKNNKISLGGVESSEPPTSLISPLFIGDVLVSVANTSGFTPFEGIGIGASNLGYMKINDEIIGYESVGNGTLEALYRGIDGTIPVEHPVGSVVTKYELNGISLRRINTTHDISDFGIDANSYYVEIDTSADSSKGPNRSADGSLSGCPQLSFNRTSTIGGLNVIASENIQYDSLVPTYNILTPGSSTSISASIRTVSGTSIHGTETSFNDLGFEPVQLNTLNRLPSTRIVCSKINEITHLGSLPRNKSFTTAITLSSSDNNLSPILYCDTAFTEFRSNLINQPITDYVNSKSVNTFNEDPHIATYVTNEIRLQQSASSLKVILTAYKHPSSDFRVLYSLIRPDSSEITQSFELFPGYDNLTTDLNLDGYLDVVDPNQNNGKSDFLVPDSLSGEFLEYQYTASDIGPFTGYRIKIVMSGTDQANPPLIKDIRTISLA